MPVTVAGGKLTAQSSVSRGISPQGAVQADGTFSVHDSTTTFAGRIGGEKIVEGSVYNGVCVYLVSQSSGS
jgi:hypothetical protein